MPLLELDNVSFAYPESDRLALRDISLAIGEGEYVAIVGANGSGKSSLLRLIKGMVQPRSGRLVVDREKVSGEAGATAARAAVGLVFQSPADQIVSSSVEEDVAFGPENLGLPRAEIARRVAAALAAVGLEAERRRVSHFLSAGQQQRLAVAGVLAMDVRCLAFDEATAMLDPAAGGMVLELMDGLAASGKAIVHVTHNMSEAARASRIIVLDAGRIVFDGKPQELFSGRSLEAEGTGSANGALAALGLPECAALAVELGLEPRIGESAANLAARIVARGRFGSSLGAREGAVGAKGSAIVRADAAGLRDGRPRAGFDGPAFELRRAEHAYLRGTANETKSLRGIDLGLEAGASAAFVGRTGSGKSTALQLLDALIAPSAGSVRAFGLDLADSRVDLRAVRMRAPLAIQRPESALFETYAGDDVAFGPRNLGLSGQKLVERVRMAMELTGLGFEEFRDRRTRSLSGGEKRKLALAGVIAMGGDALLLDEPTSALDPSTKKAVMELAANASRGGATVVTATHSMEEAARSDLVAVFADGRIAASGDPRSIFYEGYDAAWGLGRPFACEVAVELEAAGLELGSRPLSAAELASALAGARAAIRAESAS